MTVPTELTARDRAILDLERQWFKYEGAKHQAIRDLFGLTAVRYFQIVNALIDTAAAVEYDPVLVHRLQAVRDERMAQRGLRRLSAA